MSTYTLDFFMVKYITGVFALPKIKCAGHMFLHFIKQCTTKYYTKMELRGMFTKHQNFFVEEKLKRQLKNNIFKRQKQIKKIVHHFNRLQKSLTW